MRKDKKIITVAVLCLTTLVGSVQGIASAQVQVPTSTGKCTEVKLKAGDYEMSNIFQEWHETFASYYKDEDGINQKAIYNIKENSWSTEMVEDTSMNVDGEKVYYTIYPTKNGYAEVAPDSSRVILRNDEGKKMRKQKFAKIKGWKKKYAVKDMSQISKNRYLFICQTGKKKAPQAVCVNIKTKKVVWKIKNVSDTYEIIGDEIYFYQFQMKNIGIAGKSSDMIYKYDLKYGTKCKCLDSTIDATDIRNRIPQLHGQQTEDAYPITDQEIVIAGYDGKLYAAYMSGIYVYEDRTRTWKCLVDGANDTNYSLRSGKTIVDFIPISEREFYTLSSHGNYDGEVTNFIKYWAN
nr:hypothetical protein [Eubacterium sp.]